MEGSYISIDLNKILKDFLVDSNWESLYINVKKFANKYEDLLNSQILLNILEIYINKNYEEAKRLLTINIEKNENSILYSLLGVCEIYLKNFEKALENFEKANKIDSTYFETNLYLSILKSFNFNKISEGKELYNIALKHYSTPNLFGVLKQLLPNLYINEININNLYGLKNRNIKLNAKRNKHLFITGDNGFYKTSILEGISNYFSKILSLSTTEFFNSKKLFENLRNENNPLTINIQNNFDIKHFETFRFFTELKFKFETSDFLIIYLPADRKLNTKRISKVEKVNLKTKYLPFETARTELLAFLIDLDYTYATTYRDYDIYIKHNSKENKEFIEKSETIIESTKLWLEKFKYFLKKIFKDENLDIRKENVFDEKILKYTFKIYTKEHEPFDFMELANGYNSVISIITEVLLRATKLNTKNNTYFIDNLIEGIVLLDEPESHLHIKLQKEIMPILTDFFPHIQFIVATHSPFVLNSIKNVVTYDVANQIYIDDFNVPVNELIDNYFDLNKNNVEILNKKIENFEKLLNKKNKTDKDYELITNLDIELSEKAPYISDNMYYKFRINQEKLYEK